MKFVIENPPCCRVGCDQIATHHLRLHVWGKGEAQLPARALVAQIPMLMCGEHVHEAKLEDVLDITGWHTINEICIANGRALPGIEDLKLVPTLGGPFDLSEETADAAH